jgi:hypothetical protein
VPGDLSKLADEAERRSAEIAEWTASVSRASPAPVAAVIAFAQSACSLAARGVEHPRDAIVLGGLWCTTVEWPLVDLVASVLIAGRQLEPLVAPEDRWNRAGLVEWAQGAGERELATSRTDAHHLRRLLAHADRDLFRSAAALSAYTAPEGERREPPEFLMNSVAVCLRRAGAAALAAAAIAPEPPDVQLADLRRRYRSVAQEA